MRINTDILPLRHYEEPIRDQRPILIFFAVEISLLNTSSIFSLINLVSNFHIGKLNTVCLPFSISVSTRKCWQALNSSLSFSLSSRSLKSGQKIIPAWQFYGVELRYEANIHSPTVPTLPFYVSIQGRHLKMVGLLSMEIKKLVLGTKQNGRFVMSQKFIQGFILLFNSVLQFLFNCENRWEVQGKLLKNFRIQSN